MRSGKVPVALLMLVVAVLAGAGGIAVGLWKVGYFEPVVEPPVPVEGRGLEPVVAAIIEDHLGFVRAEPRWSGPWASLGMVYHFNDLIDLAAPCYEQSLKLQPDQPKVYYCLARVRSELGDVAGAIEAIDQAIALSVDDHTGHDHDLDGHAGHDHAEDGAVDGDVDDGGQTHAGGHSFLHWRRGFWLLDQGNIDEAEVAFARSREIRPLDPVGRIGMGRALSERQAWKAAIRELEGLLSTTSQIPNEDYVNNLLAVAYTQIGELEKAGEFRSEEPRHSLVWADPWNDALVHEFRWIEEWVMEEAVHYIAAGREADAIDQLELISASRRQDPRFLKTLAMAYSSGGRLPEALRLIEQTLAIVPDDYQASFDQAYLLEQLERFDEAIDAAQRTLALDREQVGAYVLLGRTLTRASRFAEALVQLNAATKMDNQHPTAWYVKAWAHVGAGELTAAEESLRYGEMLDPDSLLLPYIREMLEQSDERG